MISGGRAILGLGAAWNEDEHIAFGYTFPRGQGAHGPAGRCSGHRQGHVHPGPLSYEGPRFERRDIIDSPKPVQSGGPKIMVGGGGEQRTLRIAAKYADMTHWFPMGMDASSTRRTCCTATARRSGAIRPRSSARWAHRWCRSPTRQNATRSWSAFLSERRAALTVGSPEQCADGMKPYLDAGFTGFTFGNTLYRTPDQIRRRRRDAAPDRRLGRQRLSQSPFSCFMRPMASISMPVLDDLAVAQPEDVDLADLVAPVAGAACP